jgi:hypothetical protein
MAPEPSERAAAARRYAVLAIRAAPEGAWREGGGAPRRARRVGGPATLTLPAPGWLAASDRAGDIAPRAPCVDPAASRHTRKGNATRANPSRVECARRQLLAGPPWASGAARGHCRGASHRSRTTGARSRRTRPRMGRRARRWGGVPGRHSRRSPCNCCRGPDRGPWRAERPRAARQSLRTRRHRRPPVAMAATPAGRRRRRRLLRPAGC